MSALIGKIIGDYRVVASAGARAVGEAFVARHRRTDREVLLHVRRLRFDRWAYFSLLDIGLRLAAIRDATLPRIIALGTDDEPSIQWLAMERPPGRTVREVLRESGRPPQDALHALAESLRDAILAARRSGLMLEEPPGLDSVFVDPDNPDAPWYDLRVVLCDWALAKLQAVDKSGSDEGGFAIIEPERQRADALVHAFLIAVAAEAATLEGDVDDDEITVPWGNLIGATLGSFCLEESIGRTRGAEVFRARDHAADIEVALHVRSAGNLTDVERVLEGLNRLQLHVQARPGLAPILAFGSASGYGIVWYATTLRGGWTPLCAWMTTSPTPGRVAGYRVDLRFPEFRDKLTAQQVRLADRLDPAAVFVDTLYADAHDDERTELVFADWVNAFLQERQVAQFRAPDETLGERSTTQSSSAHTKKSMVRVARRAISQPAIEWAWEGFRSAHEATASQTRADDDVQFTCYSPNRLEPERFHSLLVFAHKGTPVALEDGTMFDPVAEVEAQAQGVLGAQRAAYRSTVQESREAIPHAGLLTFALELPSGMTGNPLTQSVQWLEPVYRVEFRVKADASLDGTTARGRVLVYLGAIMIAEIALRFAIAVSSTADGSGEARTPVSARRYRRIFASYSRHDAAIVEQFSAYAEAMGDRYLKDVVSLRAGERWGEGLQALIREADVFQLFWSSRAMESPFVRQEWEFALSLGRDGFVRPCYWEMPLPQRPPDLPPPPLQALHFQALRIGPTTHSADLASESVEAPPQISTPRVAAQTFPRSPIHPVDPSAPPPSVFSPTTAEDTGEPTQAQHSGGPQPSTVMLVLGTMLLVVLIAAAVLAVR